MGIYVFIIQLQINLTLFKQAFKKVKNSMKKIPSYPKITANTNITFTQTQKININSPKAFSSAKKMFKIPAKTNDRPATAETTKSTQKLSTKYSQVHLNKPHSNSRRKSSGHKKKMQLNLSEVQQKQKQQKQEVHNKEQLKKLQQKLKLLENKINTLKKQKRKQSASHRSNTKQKKQQSVITNAKSSIFSWKKESDDKHKKMLKKSHSDKGNLRMSNFKSLRNGISGITPKSKQNTSKVENQDKNTQFIHKFVTQVPKSSLILPPKNIKSSKIVDQSLKDSVTDSLKKNLHFSAQNQQQSLYYIENALKSLVNPALHPVRQHIVQSIQTLNFLQNVRKPHLHELDPHCVKLPPTNHQYCIVLDLDETLIHCNQSINVSHDVSLTIKFPTGEKIEAGVNIRPYAVDFLKQVSKFAQVIVFTASHECYANVVLDHLDPHKKYISHRLFRDHCWQTEQGIYIKDLRVLGNRSLKNMLLVDNAAYSYFYQIENGVPIIPYYDDKSDIELFNLLHYIKRLINIHKNENQTLPKVNHHFFKLNHYTKFDDIGLLVRNLYEETVLTYKQNTKRKKYPQNKSQMVMLKS